MSVKDALPDTPERRVKAEESRFRPVSGEVLLAAIERVDRHRGNSAVEGARTVDLAEHLSFAHTAQTKRSLAAELAALLRNGHVERCLVYGVLRWRITTAGRQRLVQARASGQATLPEAPQRRLWRHSRELAAETITPLHQRIRCLAGELDKLVLAPNIESEAWRSIGERLRGTCEELERATYSLHEWPEPDDDSADPHSWHEYRLASRRRRERDPQHR